MTKKKSDSCPDCGAVPSRFIEGDHETGCFSDEDYDRLDAKLKTMEEAEEAFWLDWGVRSE